MIFEKTNFRKFSVDTRTIRETLSTYKPPCWPLEWEIVCLPDGDASEVYEWAREGLEGRLDTTIAHTGDLLVGFSNPTDAILFKISYTK